METLDVNLLRARIVELEKERDDLRTVLNEVLGALRVAVTKIMLASS